ncbi:hypothetical protein ACQE98_09650 [Ornithinimicrobium sp. W1679]|uniref:hypothetical protein n=1 Tax=Ornithinimicrobium sp. W1679 TaxID=3418770 RepID=UPI003CF11DDF
MGDTYVDEQGRRWHKGRERGDGRTDWRTLPDGTRVQKLVLPDVAIEGALPRAGAAPRSSQPSHDQQESYPPDLARGTTRPGTEATAARPSTARPTIHSAPAGAGPTGRTALKRGSPSFEAQASPTLQGGSRQLPDAVRDRRALEDAILDAWPDVRRSQLESGTNFKRNLPRGFEGESWGPLADLEVTAAFLGRIVEGLNKSLVEISDVAILGAQSVLFLQRTIEDLALGHRKIEALIAELRRLAAVIGSDPLTAIDRLEFIEEVIVTELAADLREWADRVGRAGALLGRLALEGLFPQYARGLLGDEGYKDAEVGEALAELTLAAAELASILKPAADAILLMKGAAKTANLGLKLDLKLGRLLADHSGSANFIGLLLKSSTELELDRLVNPANRSLRRYLSQLEARRARREWLATRKAQRGRPSDSDEVLSFAKSKQTWEESEALHTVSGGDYLRIPEGGGKLDKAVPQYTKAWLDSIRRPDGLDLSKTPEAVIFRPGRPPRAFDVFRIAPPADDADIVVNAVMRNLDDKLSKGQARRLIARIPPDSAVPIEVLRKRLLTELLKTGRAKKGQVIELHLVKGKATATVADRGN